MNNQKLSLRTGQSAASDPRLAVQELHEAIAQPGLALVVFFCSSDYDLDVLAAEINGRFAGTPVIGCTTAGEIGPGGYRSGGLVGVGFAGADFSAVVGRVDGLVGANDLAVRNEIWRLRRQISNANGESFALLLLDGLSACEESIAHACQLALDNIPLVGGSAGDDQRFVSTCVFADGNFRSDRAVLAILTTRLPFKVFRSHHFVGTSEMLVVTEAEGRIVREINGWPAAQAYARAAGIGEADLTPAHFAAAPLVVRINGKDYVRSIQQRNADDSLTLYCAIERGVVLRVARSLDMLQIRRNLFDELRQSIGAPQLVLGADCVHCQLEAQAIDGKSGVEQLYLANRVLGFSGYGEQYMGIHVNQTFSGVAIGEAA
ncbi:MAG: hypothetical protein H6R14_1411 [Proteobacteria bacterium]|nr:hypothetical protein [Pseudomonadota bacterium]